MEPLKLFIIHRHPTDADLISARTHTCNTQYIHEIAMRFHLSSVYPQPVSLANDRAHAQGEGIIEGVKVLFYMEWNKDMTAWGLWTLRDIEEELLWFGELLFKISDLIANRIPEKYCNP